MYSFVVYILYNLLAIALIINGRRNSKKVFSFFGIIILFISIGIPVLSFLAGVMDGYKS